MTCRSRPLGEDDVRINARLGGNNLYGQDTDGHLWEILTVSYARVDSPLPTGATARVSASHHVGERAARRLSSTARGIQHECRDGLRADSPRPPVLRAQAVSSWTF
jgi:hypothetical protein